jgi:hypothetical protein
MDKLVNDIANGEARGSAVTKMREMIDAKLGAGSATSAILLGDLRTLLNSAAPSAFQIANGEVGASVRAKLNAWHNMMDRLIDKLFYSTNFGIWADPTQVANLNWRRNLLVWTEDFANAAWTKDAVTVSGAVLIPTVSSALHELVIPAVSVVLGQTYTLSAEVQASGYNFIQVILSSNVTGNGGTFRNFDLSTGAVGQGNTASHSITSLGGGRYRITVRVLADGTGNSIMLFSPRPDDGARRAIFAGDGTSGVLITNVQFEPGSTATDYQPITDGNTELRALFPNVTLYTDSAGTAPYTTPAQSVGLVLDRSKGLVLGSELVTNGDFSDGTTGWTNASTGTGTFTVSSGVATISGTDGSNRGFARQSITCVVGKSYLVTADIGGAAANFALGTTNLQDTTGIAVTASGPTRFIISPTATTMFLKFWTTASGSTSTIDNISVRELQGFHAAQPTAAARPAVGRAPAAGRRNWLLNTENFGASSWNFALTTATSTTPIGQSVAQRLQFASGNNTVSVTSAGRVTATLTSLTLSCKIRRGDFDAAVGFRFGFYNNTTLANVGFVRPDFSTGTIVQTLDTVTSSSLVAVPGEANTYQLTMTVPAVAGNVYQPYFGGVGTDSGTGFFDIAEMQVENGTIRTNYQRIGASNLDITEAGLPSPEFIRFDFSDDVLPTTFPAGFTGDVMLFGRNGSHIQRGVTVGSGGVLNIGPSTLNVGATQIAAPGLLRGLGDIAGWVATNRTITDPEIADLMRFHRARGAKGLLVPGSNLILNGTFDSDTVWTKGTGWTISGGVATFAGHTEQSGLTQPLSLVPGRAYLVTYTVTRTAGSVTMQFTGGTSVISTARGSSGTFTDILVPLTGNNTFRVNALGTFEGTVDNVTLVELTPQETP